MTETRYKHVEIKATAPDSAGTFTGEVLFNPVEGDSDGERVANFTNVPGNFPLDFQHLARSDPSSVIGRVSAAVRPDGRRMVVVGKLSLGTRMADVVYERMLLPSSNPDSLSEMSVAYRFDAFKMTTDSNGVRVVHNAELIGIAVVHRGAQQTTITSVKAHQRREDLDSLNRLIDALDPMSLANVNTLLDAIEGAGKDADLCVRLEWVDGDPTSLEHQLHPNNEIRRLTEQLNRIFR